MWFVFVYVVDCVLGFIIVVCDGCVIGLMLVDVVCSGFMVFGCDVIDVGVVVMLIFGVFVRYY